MTRLRIYLHIIASMVALMLDDMGGKKPERQPLPGGPPGDGPATVDDLFGDTR